MKKILLAFLSVLMVFGIMMPVSADDDLACDAENAVACVDGVGYTALADAIEDAAEGATVQLVKDVNLAGTGLTVSKTLTLDLNGKNLEVDNGNGKLVINAGTFTLKDSVGSGKIFSESVYGSPNTTTLVYVTGEDTNFVMESGYIYSVIADNPTSNGQFGVGVIDGANATINGGKIEAGWYAIAGNGNDVDTHSEIVINGGELISVADYAIYHPHNGALTINGGVVYGAAGGIAMNRGELVVNGGTITSKGQGDTGNWGDGTGGLNNSAVNVEAKYGEVNAELNGGEFIAEENAVTIAENVSNTSTVVVTGGTYTDEVNEYADDIVVGVKTPEGYVYGADASEYMNDHIGETITVVNGTSVSAPEGSKIENKTGSDIVVNGTLVEANEEYSVPVSEKLPVCAGDKDKNCDGVVTCEEEKGEGWTWNNTTKVCEYTGKKGYVVVNTAAK